MKYETCQNCKGYIFDDTKPCEKCAYNRKHFILTFTDMADIVKRVSDMDDLLFQLGVRWQSRLSDPEIRQLADILFENTKDLDKSNQLYIELDHMNNMVIA